MNEETKELAPNKRTALRYAVHMLLTVLTAAGVAWFSHEIILEKVWDKQYLLLTGILLAVIALCCFIERNNQIFR